MSAPWMPFYVRDYLADTGHLSASEHGAYLLLIMHYWQRGDLPTEDNALARIARMPEREWAKAKPTIAAFFQDGWHHQRIDAELRKSQEKSIARAEAGARGGLAKASKQRGKHVANATILPEQKDADALASSHNHIHSSSLRSDDSAVAAPEVDWDRLAEFAKAKTKRSGGDGIKKILEAVLLPEIAAGVIDHRKKLRKPLTEIGAAGLAKAFASTGNPDAAARMMIERGWQGFKLEWFENDRVAAQPRAGPIPIDGRKAVIERLERMGANGRDNSKYQDCITGTVGAGDPDRANDDRQSALEQAFGQPRR